MESETPAGSGSLSKIPRSTQIDGNVFFIESLMGSNASSRGTNLEPFWHKTLHTCIIYFFKPLAFVCSEETKKTSRGALGIRINLHGT